MIGNQHEWSLHPHNEITQSKIWQGWACMRGLAHGADKEQAKHGICRKSSDGRVMQLTSSQGLGTLAGSSTSAAAAAKVNVPAIALQNGSKIEMCSHSAQLKPCSGNFTDTPTCSRYWEQVRFKQACFTQAVHARLCRCILHWFACDRLQDAPCGCQS